MFRFFRKHRWILIFAMAITAVTFVFFMGQGGNRNNSGAEPGDFGTIYGRKVTQQEYIDAQNEFKLYYWFRNGQWPDHSANLSANEMDQEIYVNIILERKAQDFGIRVSEDSVAASAALLLHQLDHNGQRATLDNFEKQVLQPESLTVDDFQRFARRDILVRQLIAALGLPGALITPQQAQDLYEREHQEISAQAAFFSASNYLADVPVTSAAVGQFYTNYMAYYRLPERVQVSYVEFNLSNYMAAAEQKIGTTNLNFQVEEIFRERGMDAVPGAKTAAEEREKIHDVLLRQQAATDARQKANDFAAELFNQTPMSTENLAALAKKENLPVVTPKPFSQEFGPDETPMPAAFTTAAFALTADQPISEPIAGPTSFYVLALSQRLPSEVQSLDQIHDRVVSDYQTALAMQLAQRSGTNFVQLLNAQMAAGKNFANACAEAGIHPETLAPFSLGTTDLPELGNRADIQQIKQAAFTTPVGRASGFQETQDGGFVVFVEKKLPANAAEMTAQLPDYMEQLRRAREVETFNAWIEAEANREFPNVPAFKKEAAAAGVK